ncbi:PREDICTED: ly6/PLAUR domain-containing protein 3-like [Gekko japonicus]|uniref:Ly6/PLAUR domain-containing protein 3-like n=1 Tax=Gekko japonicus TaxID=146911 RepID=A0ABM1JI50_GEKJA|nr:PREDICTED: ly6/PLAUR domain-containing protein 3-like [Gekko japonicus]
MGSHFLFQACVLLGALMFSSKGALALECHSCVDVGDGGCSPENMKKMKCSGATKVCMETVAAVQWSHGNFLIGEKGCGLGMPGQNDKAVELHGIIAFSQLYQCNSSRCNNKLDLKALQLQTTGNETAMVPNGVECYSCHGEECSTDNATIVKCYDSFRGCFHGNITMRAGKFSLTRPIKGCVQDEECTKVTRGSPTITLVGSCCSGNLCNVDLSNKTYFAPKIPRLAVLPDQSNNGTTEEATPGYIQDSLPAPTDANKETPSVAGTPSLLDRNDHDHDHEHDHDHDHDHDANDEANFSVRNEYFLNAVKVEERKHQEQAPTTYSNSVSGLGGSILLVLLLAGLLM